MEHYPWLLVVLSSAAASAVTWGACRWWFRRQLAAAGERLEKLDRARVFLGQQVMQARKQAEKLQRESAAMPPRPVVRAAPVPSRSAQLEAVLRSVETIPSSPPLPVNGFAETQAMQRTP